MKFKLKAAVWAAASVGLLLGAVQAQAQFAYDVQYTQSFSGLVFGNPTAGTIAGSFSAIDFDDNGQISAGEINLSTLTFNLSGVVGAANFAGAQINLTGGFNWVVGDANMTNALSGASFSSIPAAGVGMIWQVGPAQGLLPPVGLLYLVNNQTSPVLGYFPAGQTNAVIFSSVITAIPEPETYLMLLAGIAGLAAVVRRRRG